MESSTKETAAVNLKTALEAFAGHEIAASPEQIEQGIRNMTVAVGAYSFTPIGTGVDGEENIGEVMFRNAIFAGPPICLTSELLDIGGITVTGDAGSVTVSVKSFLCPDEAARFYREPVNIVATAVSTSPCFLTVTHALVVEPASTDFPDVQITIFAWGTDGAPAPGVRVNWRCRVPTTAG